MISPEPMAMAEEDRPGALLAGRYRLERIVGRGASATVWEATHVVTSQTVALKIFGRDAGLAGDGKRRDRLLREARAASRSRHPHVLAIDDLLDLEDGRAVLVMPMLRGQSLRDRLAHEGKLSTADVRALFAPALEGLARAHDAGVVHRDLKPDNLFVVADEPPRLVVLDFGVAKIAADGDLGLTSTGVTVGTPFYMAPEQLFGEDDVDARADVWALGVVLFECLVGERPTEAPNLGQLLKRVSAGKVGRLAEHDVADAPALVDLVNAMLSLDRDARPTLEDVRAKLLAPPDLAVDRASRAAEVAIDSAPPAPTAAPTHPRRRPIVIAAIVASLGVGGLVARAAFRGDTPGDVPTAATISTPSASVPSPGDSRSHDGPATAPLSSLSSTPLPASSDSATPRAFPPTIPSAPRATQAGPSSASAVTKMVAPSAVSAVSSTSVPPRIVEQAPF